MFTFSEMMARTDTNISEQHNIPFTSASLNLSNSDSLKCSQNLKKCKPLVINWLAIDINQESEQID